MRVTDIRYRNPDMNHLQSAVVEIASSFLGFRETKNNAVWTGEKSYLDQLKIALNVVGHKPGEAYCLYFARAVWWLAAQDRNLMQDDAVRTDFLTKTIKTGHVVTAGRDLKKQELLSEKPDVGAIMLLAFGKTGRGHAGIVTAFDDNWVRTIDGNTSFKAAETIEQKIAGDGISTNIYNLKILSNADNRGLHLIGYLHLPDVKY